MKNGRYSQTTLPPLRTIKCRHCKKKFEKSWQLAQHVKFDHPDKKKKYQPRTPKVPRAPWSQSKPQAQEPYAKFCPNCGCNIEAVNVAMTIKGL